ncbi:MAG: TolC family protein, partial [Betaproteobacteria bacterium]
MNLSFPVASQRPGVRNSGPLPKKMLLAAIQIPVAHAQRRLSARNLCKIAKNAGSARSIDAVKPAGMIQGATTVAFFAMTIFYADVKAEAPVNAVAPESTSTTFGPTMEASATNGAAALDALIAEAMESNPEIRSALREREAASQRIAPAEALDDPILEAGVINAPLASSTFNREDMTMKMIGLSQRVPFPGKRGLRKDVAMQDAQSVGHGYQETVNRVARDIKTAYFDLGLILEKTRLVEKNKLILEDIRHIAEQHYGVGLGSQADALKAQTQVSRMLDELLKLARERRTVEAELIRALGRNATVTPPVPDSPQLREK